MLRCSILLTRPPMTIADAFLAYLAVGVSLSVVAVVRRICSQSLMRSISLEVLRSGLPMWLAAMGITAALVIVIADYTVLWPIRLREVLR